jgi:hypothetical protein
MSDAVHKYIAGFYFRYPYNARLAAPSGRRLVHRFLTPATASLKSLLASPVSDDVCLRRSKQTLLPN